MGSGKPIYRIKSTGQLVIEKGCDIKLTSSQSQGAQIQGGSIVYELLDEDGYGTGKEVSVSPDDLEIYRE